MISSQAAEAVRPDPFLAAYLDPFACWLDEPQVTEVMVNKPGEVWVEQNGSMRSETADWVHDTLLQRLAEQVARITNQGISRERPLLAAKLPSGARVQFVAPTATRGHWALAIRRHCLIELPLDDYAGKMLPFEQEVGVSLDEDPIAYLREAVRRKKTILISGGTSTGKTTFLNALLREVPASDRIILVEDTPEVQLHGPADLGLIAVKGELGEAHVDANDLLQASLRLRPDRIVLGELRGSEAVSFLRAVNTGHPGSLSTIHANSTTGALDQLALMVMQAGLGLSLADTIAYARGVIDIVVQLGRTGGTRGIVEIKQLGTRVPEFKSELNQLNKRT